MRLGRPALPWPIVVVVIVVPQAVRGNGGTKRAVGVVQDQFAAAKEGRLVREAGLLRMGSNGSDDNSPYRVDLVVNLVIRADVFPQALVEIDDVFQLLHYRTAEVQREVGAVVVALGMPAALVVGGLVCVLRLAVSVNRVEIEEAIGARRANSAWFQGLGVFGGGEGAQQSERRMEELHRAGTQTQTGADSVVGEQDAPPGEGGRRSETRHAASDAWHLAPATYLGLSRPWALSNVARHRSTDSSASMPTKRRAPAAEEAHGYEFFGP